jgi:hypothetical protein
MSTRSTTTGRGALPAELTTFVGRRHELVLARRTLGAPAGDHHRRGRSRQARLALRTATELRRHFRGRLFRRGRLLRYPLLLPHTVANTLDLDQVSADPAATWRTGWRTQPRGPVAHHS